MMILSIPGKPVPCPRPRVTRKGTFYTPNYIAHTDRIRLLTRSWLNKNNGGRMYKGDLNLHILFNRPHKLADIDNLTKTVLDGLQGAAFENDRQIKRLEVVVENDDEEELCTIINLGVL